MSQVTKRTATTIRHEYVLPSPARAADVSNAVNLAIADMPEQSPYPDDLLRIEAHDDYLILWWEETTRTTP